MIARMRSWWSEFFCTEEVPYGMALVRMILPVVLLIGVVPRWPHARELYSTDGAPAPIWTTYGTSPLLPDLPAPVAVGLFSVLVFCLVTASIGWRTRLSLATVTVLYAGFGLLDMVSTLTKYTVLASHALLLLTLSECGAVWSVDAWVKGRSAPVLVNGPPKSPVWPRRLLQLLLALCYLGSAFTKMHTPAYFSGDQMLFWMLANMNFENRVGEYLSLYPPVSVVSAYVTILWEVLFIALIWRRPWRWFMLGIGVVFHIMSWLMLGLIVFPLLCMAMYLVFLDAADVERLSVGGRNLARRWRLLPRRSSAGRPGHRLGWLLPSHSAAAFGLLLSASAVIGVEVEYHLDVYGERASTGPLALRELDAERTEEMLGRERPIRPQDYFFSFDVGTTTMGGLLADRRDTFVPGEQAILQCSMSPPHPDMWVEVSLQDERSRVLRRFGQIIPRETWRSNITYDFDDELAPGQYQFVLVYDGEVMARRPFRLRTLPRSERAGAKMTASR